MVTLRSLHDLMVHELRDLRAAERQALDDLPALLDAVTAPELRDAIEDHLERSRAHPRRCGEALGLLGHDPDDAHRCIAMDGLLAEASSLLDEDTSPAVLDAAVLAALQRVERYEIASYGCLATYAEMLGRPDVHDLLGAALADEEAMDERLTALAGHLLHRRTEGEAGFHPGR